MNKLIGIIQYKIKAILLIFHWVISGTTICDAQFVQHFREHFLGYSNIIFGVLLELGIQFVL